MSHVRHLPLDYTVSASISSYVIANQVQPAPPWEKSYSNIFTSGEWGNDTLVRHAVLGSPEIF